MFPRNPIVSSCRRFYLKLTNGKKLRVYGVASLLFVFFSFHFLIATFVPLSWREADLSHVVRVIVEKQNFAVKDMNIQAKEDVLVRLFGKGTVHSKGNGSTIFGKNLSDAASSLPTPSSGKYYPEFFENLARLKSKAQTDDSLQDLVKKMETFRPNLSWKEKADLLRAFDTFVLACEKAGLTYFLLEASLMGVRRHHGMIPWDDDIDIVVNASQWQELYTVLSDIPGFELFASKDTQWKFYPSSAKPFKDKPFKFPYLDIFFFSEDDDYIWAVTQGLKHDLVHRKSDIFPLLRRPFEGRLVRVPCNLPLLVDSSHDVDECITGEYNHKTNERFYFGGKISTSCAFLKLVYPFVERVPLEDRPGFVKEVLKVGPREIHSMVLPESCGPTG